MFNFFLGVSFVLINGYSMIYHFRNSGKYAPHFVNALMFFIGIVGVVAGAMLIYYGIVGEQ